MKATRYSKQRELIRGRLMATDQHPTAEMLYQWLKPDHPALSLGTIYRNLNFLAEQGEIARMSFPVERFDANIKPHPHFVCVSCGNVYDLDLPYDGELDQEASAASGGRIDSHELLFRGICSKCTLKHK